MILLQQSTYRHAYRCIAAALCMIFFFTNGALAQKAGERQRGESITGKSYVASKHFTWGFDAGASIDMNGNNMSTFDAEGFVGFRNSFIKALGGGVGIHRAFGNGTNFVPVYMIFRSSFRTKPSLFFFNLKVGYSFNTLSDSPTKGGVNFSAGVGINLAQSKNFSTHIVLSYGFFHLDRDQQIAANMKIRHIDFAQLRFGVAF